MAINSSAGTTFFRRKDFGFIENYMEGRMWIALRHVFGDKSDYGFAVYLDEFSGQFERTPFLGGWPKHSHDSGISPCGVCLNKPLVLSQNVELVQSANTRIAARSVIRLDRFNYGPVVGGEPPFEFWGVQSPFRVKKVGLGIEEREVSIDVRLYAHRASAKCRRQIEATSHGIDNCSGLCINEPWERLALASHEAIARSINIELFDCGVRASFEPGFDSAVQDWQLGYGPLYSGIGI